MVPVPYFPGAITISIIFLCIIFGVPVGEIILKILKKLLLIITIPLWLPFYIVVMIEDGLKRLKRKRLIKKRVAKSQ